MYSVYALIDPRDTVARYIGIAKDAYKRYGMHLAFTGKTKKDAWMRELKDNNLFPILDILETVDTRAEAEKREVYWIQEYLNNKVPLLNMNKAGGNLAIPVQVKQMEIVEMEDIIKQEGWTVHRLKRRKLVYIYAARRGRKHVYIAPESKINQMSQEQIISKLQK